MKVLLSAFACEPGFGSEEGVGWQTVVEMAKYHEVWVLTRGYCQHTIEPYLAANPLPNVHFSYFEPFGWSEDWKGRQGWLTLHYYLWQIFAYFRARWLSQEVQFDVAQHVTYARYWNPSFLAFLPVPFVFGPVGGGESAPAGFNATFSLRGRIYEKVRDIARFLGECDPFLRLMLRRTQVALGTTPDTAQRLMGLGAKQVKVMQALGLSTAEIETLSHLPPAPSEPVRFLSVGRFLHWKGLHLALQAFAIADCVETEYWLIGHGVEAARLHALVTQLGIRDRVTFLGVLPRAEVMVTMGQCHVLVHPSLHESGGFVCAEMMATGRPVICFDRGGPAVQVTPETGYVLPARSPRQAILDLAGAMTHLARDRAYREKLGQAAQQRVREQFDWSVKGQLLHHLYQSIATHSEGEI